MRPPCTPSPRREAEMPRNMTTKSAKVTNILTEQVSASNPRCSGYQGGRKRCTGGHCQSHLWWHREEQEDDKHRQGTGWVRSHLQCWERGCGDTRMSGTRRALWQARVGWWGAKRAGACRESGDFCGGCCGGCCGRHASGGGARGEQRGRRRRRVLR